MYDIIQETKDFMTAHGYSRKDIQWIGGKDFTIPVSDFWDSKPQFYDAGYGWQQVATDLTIVFKDGSWLERDEYDGSEWWQHRICPSMPLRIESAKKFVSDEHEASLAKINGYK